MPSEEIGSAFATVGFKIDESGLTAAKSKFTAAIGDMENKSRSSNVGSGLADALSKGTGKFSDIGKEMGSTLTAGIGGAFGPIGGLAANAASALGPVGIAAGVVAAGVLAIGSAALNSAAHWQTLMTGISKTTGVEDAALSQLSNTLQDIMMNTGATADEIANAVSVAGSIGIPTGELAAFAETAIQMGDAFNMSAEAAATAMGKIGNVVKPAEMSWTEFTQRAGSAVNNLADSMATSEAEILTGMKHLAGTMGMLKPPIDTIPSWEALVATMQSLGMTGDGAGEAIKDAMTYAARDSKGALSSLLGVSKEVFQDRLRTDAVGTMEDLARAIAALPVEQQAEALMMFGATGSQAVGLLVGDLDQTTGSFTMLDAAIQTANMAWEDATSLSEAYGKSQATRDAAMSKFSATISVAATKLGTVLLPAETAVINALVGLAQAGVKAGEALYSIVTGSQAFAAISSAFQSMEEAGTAAFDNIAAVVEPAWEAIGGGETVMKVLQAAFNAITSPITAFFTILGKAAEATKALYTAISPVASAIGSTLGDAIKTTSAYVQALEEAFTDLISNSSTVQSLVSAFDGLKTKLSEIGTVWSDIASKVINGLTTAIPTALSGLISAVSVAFGNTGEAASDAFTDSIRGSPVGAIFGFAEGISTRASEIMGAGDKAAGKVAEGVKKNDALAKAPGEALQSDKALAGASEAGGKLAEKTLSAFAKQAQASNLSDLGLLGIINSQSDDSKIKSTVYDLYGTAVTYWKDAAESHPTAHITIDGVDYYIDGKNASVAELLASLGFSDEIISGLEVQATTKVTNAIQKIKDSAATEAKKKQELEFNFDISKTEEQIEDWSPAVQTRIKSFFKSVETTIDNSDGLNSAFTKKIKEAGDNLNEALSSISLEGLADLDNAWQAEFDALGTDWSGSLGDIATDSIAQYKENLLAGIADTGTYVDAEMERIGESAQTALQDGFISEDEQALFVALGDQIGALRELFPKEMADVTDETIEKMVALINEGKLQEAFALAGKESGEEFSDNLLDGADIEVTLKELAINPEEARKQIADPLVYAWRDGIDQAVDIVRQGKTDIMEGYVDPAEMRTRIIDSFSPLNDVLPGWFNNLVADLSNSRISVADFFNAVDSGYEQTQKLRDSIDSNTKATDKYAASTQKATGHTATFTHQVGLGTNNLIAMGLAINPLAEISGKGISVSFTPAQVIADKAYDQLTSAGNAVKIGLNSEGQKIAVIGQTAQTQFKQAGGTFISDASTAGTYLKNAASTANSLMVSGLSNILGRSTGTISYRGYGFAEGTKTTGPQMALIGEDGAAHPEYVIPTKTKRWDLLYAAMRAYGIPGYAEGTSTGSAGAEATDSEEMKAYFGIKGLASMSKQVQKIINDLKNFFRISWGIIKAEGAVYWKQIETVIATETTTIRDGAWQAALDIRNVWLTSSAGILTDTTASYAAMWPAILPSLAEVHDGTLATFADMDSQVRSILEQMISDTENAFTTFKSDWDTVWSQMLADLQSTASEITSILQSISAQVSNIAVNVSIGSTGGSSGGGATYSSGGSQVSSSISSVAQTFTDCLFEGFEDSCTGVIVNALKYTSPSGQVSYVNPMDNAAVRSLGGSSSSYSSGSSGYTLPAIFRAKGALVDNGPELDIVGEAGPELILPANLTRMFLSLADAGLGQGAQGAAASSIVIEDHTEHHWYMDGKEVTNQIMSRVQKQLQLKGAVSTR